MLEAIFLFSLVVYFVPFCLSLAIALFKKGKSALHWNEGMVKSAIANISLNALNIFVAPSIYILTGIVQSSYDTLQIPHIPTNLWEPVPIIVMMAFGLIVKDFADYWNHRLMHTRYVWPVHAVHHSDPDMNHTTSLRVHLLEAVIMIASYTILLSWLGLPPEASATLSLFRSFYNKFVHIDVDIHWGPLVKVIATPRYHQWHHADVPEAHNKNFANIFSFWDVIFGTYYVPGPCNVKYGFHGSPNHDVAQLFLWPFLVPAKATLNRIRSVEAKTGPKQSQRA